MTDTGLAQGSYSATITLTHDLLETGTTSTTIPVSLQVTTPRLVASTPAAVSVQFETNIVARVSFVLTNEGSSSVAVNALAATGAFTGSEASFVGITPPVTINGGASLTVNTDFTLGSRTRGVYTGSITVTTNTVSDPTITVAYSVTVVAPVYVGPADISRSLAVGTTSPVTVQATVSNTGTATLTVNAVVGAVSWVSLTSSASLSIAAGGTGSFTLSFNPTDVTMGDYNTILTISHNDPPVTGGTDQVSLALQMQQGVVSLTTSSASSSVYFGSGTTTSTFTVGNTGTGTLSVSNIASSAGFAVCSPTSFTIASGGTARTVTITWTKTSLQGSNPTTITLPVTVLPLPAPFLQFLL